MQIEDVLKDSNKSRVANRLKGNNGRWCRPSPSDIRHAAVLVSLLMVDCEPAVLLTVRSNQLLRHRGQVRYSLTRVIACGNCFVCFAQFPRRTSRPQ